MAGRHAQALAELSQLGLSLARDLHARALAAETTQEACELGLAFQRTARAVRQAVALECRLERDARRLIADDRQAVTAGAQARIDRRKTQVRIAVERTILSDYEGADAENLLEDLEVRLDEAALLDEAFTDLPLESLIARLEAEIGLTGDPDHPPPALRRHAPNPRPLFNPGELERRIARETYEGG